MKSDIYKILADQFTVSVEEISDNIGPGDLYNWDSLGQMQLILRLEKEFNIQLSLEDAMSMNSVKDIVSIVEKYSSGKKIEISTGEKAIVKDIATHSLRLPKITYWGEGCIAALHRAEQSRIAVIMGMSNYASEMKQKIQEYLLSKPKISFIQRSSGEPKEPDIYKVAEILKTSSPNLIIAIGGGSTLDTAKLSWALYEHPELALSDLLKPFSLLPLRAKASFIAIPTTFGSGSEVSSAAAFSKDDSTSKAVILSHEFIPDQVILDPNLGKSMPLNVVYAGAFDALTHAIEGYVSIVSNPLVDPYAIYSVRNILSALQGIQQQGLTPHSLRLLCYCAYYSGIVQNHCSVGLTHSISHQLGSYGISHGLGNALFLTLVMEYNAKGTDKYKQLARECDFESLDELVNLIQVIFEDSNILPGQQVLKRIINDKISIIESAMADITFRTNPIVIKEDELGLLFNEFERKFL